MVSINTGSLVNTADQSHPITRAKLDGKNITHEERLGSGATHSYQTVYNAKVAGFTLHTFSADFSTLTTQFISYTGAVVHSFSVNKNGAIA
jgi:hypothetical protein